MLHHVRCDAMIGAALAPVPAGTTVDVAQLLRTRQRAWLAAPALQWADASAGGGPRTSPMRSRGIEYVESRAYVPGDDVRHMDWRVTARTSHPHTKLYHEARGRDVMLLVDVGDSMRFGTRSAFKSVVAAHAAMLLAWAARESGDRVGALVCGRDHRAPLHPGGREGTVLELARLLTRALSSPHSQGSAHPGRCLDLTGALEHAAGLMRPRGLLVAIGDLYALDHAAQQRLAGIATQHTVLLCLVVDPMEMEPPPPGRYPVTDGGDTTVLDTRSGAGGDALRDHFDARVRRLDDVASRPRIRCITVGTGVDVASALGACVPPGDARTRFARP